MAVFAQQVKLELPKLHLSFVGEKKARQELLYKINKQNKMKQHNFIGDFTDGSRSRTGKYCV